MKENLTSPYFASAANSDNNLFTDHTHSASWPLSHMLHNLVRCYFEVPLFDLESAEVLIVLKLTSL